MVWSWSITVRFQTIKDDHHRRSGRLDVGGKQPGDGAIEDAEQRGSRVFYFFKSGVVGVVDLVTKGVSQPKAEPI